MITTTETTALASNNSTPTRRASWKDSADVLTRASLKQQQQHTYTASTPFLTEKNHSPHPLSSPAAYSADPAKRSSFALMKGHSKVW